MNMPYQKFYVHLFVTVSLTFQALSTARSPVSRMLTEPIAARDSLFEYELSHHSGDDIDTLKKSSTAKSVSHLITPSGGSTLAAGECRAYPGDELWPAKTQWNALNDLLGGALISTIPVAAPCYQAWGRFDEEKCDKVLANWTNPYFQQVLYEISCARADTNVKT